MRLLSYFRGEAFQRGVHHTVVQADGEHENPPSAVPAQGHRALVATHRQAGDLYRLHFDTSRFERLTRTDAEESLPRVSPDGRRLAFVRAHDLWLLDLASGAETRVTRDGSATILNGTLSWVYGEEVFGPESGLLRWAHDSSAFAFLRTDESPVAVSTFVDIVPETPRVVEQRYPKAGGANPIVQLGIHDLATGRTAWLDRSTVPYEYLVRIEWLADSSALGVETLNRAQDRADVYRVEPGGAARRVLRTESVKNAAHSSSRRWATSSAAVAQARVTHPAAQYHA